MAANNQFYKDLQRLKEKYPMCYIEAWTPEDFNASASKKLPWNNERHVDHAASLYDEFDAEYGTNWARVNDSIPNSI